MQPIIKIIDFKDDALKLFELFKDEPYPFFLDSSQMHPQRGRYSFMGFAPFDVFKAKAVSSLHRLRSQFKPFAMKDVESPSPLTAGLVGFISYDYGLYQENIKVLSKQGLRLPDILFGFYDCIITIDHFKQKMIITSTGLPEKTEGRRKKRAEEKLAFIDKKLSELNAKKAPEPEGGADYFELASQSSFTKEAYIAAVEKALEYIAGGDIYQVNLSQCFYYDLAGHPLNALMVYKKLRELSPTSFSAYFDGGAFKIMSSSPERFLQFRKGIVQTRPMKGTRPRGHDDAEDEKFRREIRNSSKEKAELLMITDLLRNDLGRVCEYGSIKVKEMRAIEEYKTVFQATSTVEGILKKGKDPFDLLEACLPGGSISGCPKIRSLQIIEELEPLRRGVYTGTLGYINLNGEMDFSILIRTLISSDNTVCFHTGSGIVADSRPEDEYNEVLVKARAMQECLQELLRQPQKA